MHEEMLLAKNPLIIACEINEKFINIHLIDRHYVKLTGSGSPLKNMEIPRERVNRYNSRVFHENR
jgi:hypothetical protein